MKKLLLAIFLGMITQKSLQGQSISPTAQAFSVGQAVKFNLIGSGNIGVENEIKKVSESVMINNLTVYDAGTPQSPGFFRVDFIATDGKRTKFQILVLPTGFTASEKAVLNVPALNNDQSSLINKFFTLTEVDRTIILKESFRKYINNHTVSVGTTFVVCIATAPGGPATFAIACGKQVAGNAKDFLIIYIETATNVMVSKQLITKDASDIINNSAKVGGLVFELATSNFDINSGKLVLKKGGTTTAENIVTLLNSGTDLIDNKKVETAGAISSDFAKKYISVIELLN